MKRILLSMSVFLAMSVNAQITDCTDLFFSEYVEGSSQNKAIEIYNPTTTSIDLSDYSVERFSNGATNSSGGGVTDLSGMLASGVAFVLTNGETDVTAQFGYCDPALVALGDLAEPNGSYPTPMHMNGNDAIVLTKKGVIIDVFGKVGENPGTAWSDPTGTWWTNDHTLIRKGNVLKGDIIGLDSFDPSLEWDSLPNGTWNNLGTHNCDCISTSAVNDAKEVSYIVYPNPANTGDVVTVNTTANVESIDVLNILGEKVLGNNSNKIKTDELAKGSYVILIRLDDTRVLESKIIIE